MYEELKTLHVLAVILLGGTVLVDAMTGIIMGQAARVQDLRPLVRLSKANQFTGIAAAVTVPLFGYLTATDGDWDLGSTWLLVGQVLFWAAVVIGFGIMMPGAMRLARNVAELPDGPIPDEVMKELKNPIFPALGGLLTVFFVVIVYFMVSKTGL